MAQDKRYTAIRNLIKVGDITKLEDMFMYVKETQMRKDLNIGYHPWRKKMKNFGLFELQQMKKLASLIGVDYLVIVELINKGCPPNDLHQ